MHVGDLSCAEPAEEEVTSTLMTLEQADNVFFFAQGIVTFAHDLECAKAMRTAIAELRMYATLEEAWRIVLRYRELSSDATGEDP